MLKKISFLFVFTLSVFTFFTSCKKEESKLKKELNLNCKKGNSFGKLQTVSDTINNGFEIDLPEDWTGEIEGAGTATSLTYNSPKKLSYSTYNIKIFYVPEKNSLNQNFIKEYTKEITKVRKATILKSGHTEFQGKPAYYFYFNFDHFRFGSRNLQIHISNNEKSYYGIEVEIIRSQHPENEICEIFELLEDIQLLK